MKKYLTKNLCFLLAVIMLLVMGGCSTGAASVADPGRETESSTDTIPIETTTATAPTTEPKHQDSTEPPEFTPDETTENTAPATEPNNPTQNPKPPVEDHTHNYTESVVKPTCTSKGYTQHKCSCGDSYKDAQTAALGHEYTERVITPTIENKGYTEHVCVLCGHSYKDSYTDKLPVVESTEPTVCQHNWQAKYYPEVGHYGEYYNVCKCGFRFGDPSEWSIHVKNAGGDAVIYHTNWGSNRDYIVDSPERWEWVCSGCGAVTDTQP